MLRKESHSRVFCDYTKLAMLAIKAYYYLFIYYLKAYNYHILLFYFIIIRLINISAKNYRREDRTMDVLCSNSDAFLTELTSHLLLS